jgi:predicted NBD/HSP70 family sugar kinase
MTVVLVPAARAERWVGNFTERHGETSITVLDGALRARAADGSTFTARLPFAQGYDGQPDAGAFADAISAPPSWGLILVRKGGFAIARLEHQSPVESKIGRRHVQGRTKAGGQSQQRFARRRDNQARQAYEAAADHAARILGAVDGMRRALIVVTGGDHAAVAEVLADPRLSGITVVDPFLAVPDPRRAILEQAARDAASARFEVVNS